MLNQLLRKEDQLLTFCARVSPSCDAEQRIDQLLDQPLEWQAVLDRAWWHRLRPLVHLHLRTRPEGQVPARVLADLADHAMELAARNLRLSAALEDVASVFERQKLRVLVFKGPTLAADAYGDPSLRECGDLDMLVHHADFFSVRDMLTRHGFASSWDRVSQNRAAFACEFLRRDVELDVHWDLAPGWFNYRVDFDGLWRRGLRVAKDFEYARKMRPEDALVVLCIHGTKHWWERLRWICDIAEIVNRGLIQDWDHVWAEAENAQARCAVELGLKLAGELLAAQLPAEVLQELDRSPSAERLARQVGLWLADADRSTEARNLTDRFLFRLRLCQRARDRVPQIMHYLRGAPPRLSVRPH